MKFRCERDVLADAVGSAGRAATNRTGTLPVLAGVRMEVAGDTLTVTGTDLELTIRLTVEVGGEQDGAAVVPARLVGDIVKALPAGAVEISLDTSGDSGEMSISAGRSQFSVRPLSLDDYPAQTEPSGEAVTLSAETMSDALRQVVRAASTDDARAVLTGVLLASEDEGVRMVATDSYRLAVRDLPDSTVLGSGQKVLIPGRALNELQRVMGDVEELTVRFGEREATFEAGTTRLSTRLIEGEFPNYRNLLPSSYPNLLTVSKASMMEAIRRVKILAQDSTPVRLTLGGDTVQLTAITQDVGNAAEEIDASYDGAEMTVAFNPDYLAAGIDAIDADDVTLATMDPMKPAVLRGAGQEDYLYLLMPVRVP
ncbi:DNA polymerase III subunit beta [Ilumatobacter coccineus]|uniref:Beta sliding clamp n=1 Tax=Ilumatobacter coccineus (strain NBRC 103263 / KCTC 29153 / YM16-304) TaxID=1313172 RepID=A0A6C7E8F4_ILUCY|nr:DNA polymerase III subunit beta [Ilumatobacter coccineus]BAN00316.1 DNA polymerase III beta subunit [Ilumatobacter coccineus YM16-304]